MPKGLLSLGSHQRSDRMRTLPFLITASISHSDAYTGVFWAAPLGQLVM